MYSSGGSSSSIWSPAVTENGGGFPGDHQRLAWTTTTSQQQCYQNYSSYYTNMDYLSPATHQLNVVVSMALFWTAIIWRDANGRVVNSIWSNLIVGKGDVLTINYIWTILTIWNMKKDIFPTARGTYRYRQVEITFHFPPTRPRWTFILFVGWRR